MDKFVVSARKYRPQTFDTVIGQSHITTTLKNAINHNQLAHAFLFCGPRGVGKTTCARILAKTINCENKLENGEACNTCNSCNSFNNGISLNIHELDAASNNSVDDIRTLVDQVRFAPQAGKYKVYIIDEVHMLSTAAFNAFLKTLEEPPSYAIFILATTEKHKILPTILSRCQIFDFKRITLNDTVEHLHDICVKEDINADKLALQVIAQKSEGCMRDALSIMDKIASFTNSEINYANTLEHLNILDADYYFKLLDCMLNQDLSGAMLLYDDINRKGFESDEVISGFAEFIRNILVSKDEKIASLLEVVESFREKYVSASKTVSAGYWVSALNILNETEIHYKSARNKRLHVELALIKLCYLQQAIDVVMNEGSLSKKKIIESVKPVSYRAISPLREKKEVRVIAEKPQEAKLIIETAVAKPKPVAEVNVREKTEPYKPVPASIPGTEKISPLDKIRNKVKNNSSLNGIKANEPLNLENLQQGWDELKALIKADKNSAFQSFDLAKLRIVDENSFEVITLNNLDQKFIDKERVKTSAFLQDYLKNKKLQFSILIEENLTDQPVIEIPLSSKEQYFKIIAEYPIVKELKEKLRLDLDY
jgi:DNA polymerase III subunit gamma/tau